MATTLVPTKEETAKDILYWRCIACACMRLFQFVFKFLRANSDALDGSRKSVICWTRERWLEHKRTSSKFFVLFCFFSPLCFFPPWPKKKGGRKASKGAPKEDKAKKKKREETKESDTPLKFTHTRVRPRREIHRYLEKI